MNATTTTAAPMPTSLFNLDLNPDTRSRREERAQEQGLEPCTHCGRGVAVGSGWITVVIGGGDQVVHPDEPVDETDGGYMGAWVLGPQCAKSIPVTARKKWEGWS